MITAKFLVERGVYKGFIVSGHAGSARYGKDIVCAGVSSAVMLAINTITDFFKASSKIRVCDNKAGLFLVFSNDRASLMIKSLEAHLQALNCLVVLSYKD